MPSATRSWSRSLGKACPEWIEWIGDRGLSFGEGIWVYLGGGFRYLMFKLWDD